MGNKKGMKKIITVFLSVMCLWALSYGQEDFSLLVDKPVRKYEPEAAKYIAQTQDTEVVARVNGVDIPFSEVKMWYSNLLDNHVRMYPEIPLEEVLSRYKKQCVEKGIDKTLLDMEIKKGNFLATQEELEAEMKRLRASFSREQDFLNHLSTNGLTVENFESQVRFQLSLQNFFKSIDHSLPVPSEEDLRKWFEEKRVYFSTPRKIRFSLIMLRNEEGDESASKKNQEFIVKIREELASGKKDFKDFARNFSDDPVSRKNGGDFGWVSVKDLKTTFEPIKSLPLNKLSPVYIAPDSCYVAKITGDEPEKVEDFEKIKEKVKSYYLLSQKNENHKKFLEELKAKARIEILWK